MSLRQALALGLSILLWSAIPAVPASAGQATGSINQTMDRAEAHMEAGEAEAAFTLLEPLEPTMAGDTRFDYLFGIAALDVGETGRAVFALQRVVAADPGFAGARMDLARAYHQRGEYVRAEREFRKLLEQSPPADTRQVIQRYLADIEASRRPASRGGADIGQRGHYAQASVGYDSNANSATALDQFLGFDLSENSRESSTSFFGVRAGTVGGWDLGPASRLTLRGNLQARHNPDASFVDTLGGDGAIEWAHSTERDTTTLALELYRLHVDGDFNNQGAALTGSWRHSFGERSSLAFFGRLGALRFEDALAVKDVDQALAGVTWSRLMGEAGRSSLAVTLIAGQDDERQAGSPYGRDIRGIRSGFAYAISPTWRFDAAAGFVQADYGDIFFPGSFTEEREDDISDFSLRLSWDSGAGWVVEPRLSWQETDSNVDLFSYDRIELGVTARRVWQR